MKDRSVSGRLRSLNRFLPFMKGNALKYLSSMLSVVVTVAASFLTPLLVAGAVDAITDTLSGRPDAALNLPEPFLSAFSAHGGAQWLTRHMGLLALTLVAVNLIGGLFHYLRGKWSNEASEAIAESMRNRLFEHLLHMDYAYHVRAQTGDLIQRCTTDVDTIRRFLAGQFVEIVRTLVMIVLALTLMSRIHVKLTLLSLVLVPPLFLLAFWFFHWVQKLFAEADAADGMLSAMLQESLTGVRVVRAFGRQRYEEKRFIERADDVYNKSVRITNVMSVYWSGSDMLSMAQTAFTLIMGILFAQRGEITAGEVIVFVSYISMLTWPIRQLGRILQDLGKSLVAMARISEVLDAPVESDTPGACDAPLDRDIEFRHVAFSYGDHAVLKDISFHVKAGETIAILGATGSGKSTLMDLLQRLYDPDAGEIMIGGREIRTISKSCLRSRVGYVLQEPFLYSRSIRDNVKIARPDADPTEVSSVADITASTGFIEAFEQGWDTMVGERGVTLSGGQKQRVAIARTLLRDNDILILDDSLSAVDTRTDLAIRTALNRNKDQSRKRVTTFIISHRITTLSGADRILVLKDGRVAQNGTHEELIRQEGLYRRVYLIQTALEDELNAETA